MATALADELHRGSGIHQRTSTGHGRDPERHHMARDLAVRAFTVAIAATRDSLRRTEAPHPLNPQTTRCPQVGGSPTRR